MVRTAGESARLPCALKREFRSLDFRVALVEPTPLQTVLDRVLFARPRFSLLVLGIFATAGVLLVALGVYGILPTPSHSKPAKSRSVSRSAAIGGHVVRMVLMLGMQMVAVGLFIGVAVSFEPTGCCRASCGARRRTDPLTFLGAILVTMAVGAIACLVPRGAPCASSHGRAPA